MVVTSSETDNKLALRLSWSRRLNLPNTETKEKGREEIAISSRSFCQGKRLTPDDETNFRINKLQGATLSHVPPLGSVRRWGLHSWDFFLRYSYGWRHIQVIHSNSIALSTSSNSLGTQSTLPRPRRTVASCVHRKGKKTGSLDVTSPWLQQRWPLRPILEQTFGV